jgi:hypothetical protein
MANGSQASKAAGLRVIEEHGEHRSRIVRTAIINVPLALAFGAVAATALFYAVTTSYGALVGAIVFGLPAFAFGYEGLGALRDLRARPVVTRGEVARLWSKGTVLWLSRAYYLLVEFPVAGRDKPDHRFFVISLDTFTQLDEGRTVEVTHWPHTNTVVSLALDESPRPARGARR